ncbi:uncharacterized protein LOC106464443 isoform X2 [Limulus polyphemus]|uniref:Uncharacterized protein LOC106464443 isoform X2 n=1 Tax=Limulus polyphemus TaxID=6850 RepID=A0ABM1BDY0_LIMPO|nr:uncharacterized protein LOC106464443 isoform X2 [Limulus polyphemus]
MCEIDDILLQPVVMLERLPEETVKLYSETNGLTYCTVDASQNRKSSLGTQRKLSIRSKNKMHAKRKKNIVNCLAKWPYSRCSFSLDRRLFQQLSWKLQGSFLFLPRSESSLRKFRKFMHRKSRPKLKNGCGRSTLNLLKTPASLDSFYNLSQPSAFKCNSSELHLRTKYLKYKMQLHRAHSFGCKCSSKRKMHENCNLQQKPSKKKLCNCSSNHSDCAEGFSNSCNKSNIPTSVQKMSSSTKKLPCRAVLSLGSPEKTKTHDYVSDKKWKKISHDQKCPTYDTRQLINVGTMELASCKNVFCDVLSSKSKTPHYALENPRACNQMFLRENNRPLFNHKSSCSVTNITCEHESTKVYMSLTIKSHKLSNFNSGDLLHSRILSSCAKDDGISMDLIRSCEIHKISETEHMLKNNKWSDTFCTSGLSQSQRDTSVENIKQVETVQDGPMHLPKIPRGNPRTSTNNAEIAHDDPIPLFKNSRGKPKTSSKKVETTQDDPVQQTKKHRDNSRTTSNKVETSQYDPVQQTKKHRDNSRTTSNKVETSQYDPVQQTKKHRDNSMTTSNKVETTQDGPLKLTKKHRDNSRTTSNKVETSQDDPVQQTKKPIDNSSTTSNKVETTQDDPMQQTKKTTGNSRTLSTELGNSDYLKINSNKEPKVTAVSNYLYIDKKSELHLCGKEDQFIFGTTMDCPLPDKIGNCKDCRKNRRASVQFENIFSPTDESFKTEHGVNGISDDHRQDKKLTNDKGYYELNLNVKSTTLETSPTEKMSKDIENFSNSKLSDTKCLENKIVAENVPVMKRTEAESVVSRKCDAVNFEKECDEKTLEFQSSVSVNSLSHKTCSSLPKTNYNGLKNNKRKRNYETKGMCIVHEPSVKGKHVKNSNAQSREFNTSDSKLDIPVLNNLAEVVCAQNEKDYYKHQGQIPENVKKRPRTEPSKPVHSDTADLENRKSLPLTSIESSQFKVTDSTKQTCSILDVDASLYGKQKESQLCKKIPKKNMFVSQDKARNIKRENLHKFNEKFPMSSETTNTKTLANKGSEKSDLVGSILADMNKTSPYVISPHASLKQRNLRMTEVQERTTYPWSNSEKKCIANGGCKLSFSENKWQYLNNKMKANSTLGNNQTLVKEGKMNNNIITSFGKFGIKKSLHLLETKKIMENENPSMEKITMVIISI